MHPFFDEREYFAGAYENNILVLKVSKNLLNINQAKKLNHQHNDNIRFLAWQYKKNGLLASTSSDRFINLYDVLKSKEILVSRIKDDDVVKSIKFSIMNNSYLATGYDKKLKIWDITKSTLVPIIKKEIFDGGVDILEWHNNSKKNLLLCGSKQINMIKIFSVREELELMLEIKIKDVDEKYENNPNSQKILFAKFLEGNGLIAICEKKAFIYHLGDDFSYLILDQVIEFGKAITNFKIMTNNTNMNKSHYLVYIDQDNNFVTKQYTFNESIATTMNNEKALINRINSLSNINNAKSLDSLINTTNNNNNFARDRSFTNSKKFIFLKEIENLKKKYPNNFYVDNKSDRNVYIFKLSQDLITIKLKVIYNDDYPNTLPTVDFENKYESFLIDRTLISNINNEIYIWQMRMGRYKIENANNFNNFNSTQYQNINANEIVLEKLIDNMMNIINSARLQIEENADENAIRLLKKQGKVVPEENTILPYVKTCSFTWGPTGQLLTFHYNKLDFSQLKPSDKVIENLNHLEDWVKFCEAKDERNKFSRSENKLIEEDADIDVIITEKLRNIVNWKSIMDSDDITILNSINRMETVPSTFMSNNYREFYGQNQGDEKHKIHSEDQSNSEYENLVSKTNNSNNSQSHSKTFTLVENLANLNSENNFNNFSASDLNGDNFNNSNPISNLISNPISNPMSNPNNTTNSNYFKNTQNYTTTSFLTRKKSLLLTHQIKQCKENFILKNLKLKLMTKDSFFASINFLLKSMNSEETYLLDILEIINFNINSIIDPANSSDLLIKHYKLAIMTTIKTLERDKNYEYIYICILLITSRIFDNVISDVLKVPSLINENELNTRNTENTITVSFDNNCNKNFNCRFLKKRDRFGSQKLTDSRKIMNTIIKQNSRNSIGSETIIPTKLTTSKNNPHIKISPAVKTYRESCNIQRISSFDKVSGYFDSLYDKASDSHLHINDEYNIYVDVNSKESKQNSYIFTNIEDENEIIDHNTNFNNNYDEINNPFLNLNRFSNSNMQTDLIQVFGDVIISKFIDFLYFYSNELYRMNRMIERAELIKFLYLISSKLKINKFKNIVENFHMNLNPLPQRKNKRNNSIVFNENTPIPRESESLFNRFKINDEKIKKKIFKTKLLNKENLQCDICGERIKIGTLSIFSSYYNIKGHYDHVMDYIQKNYNKNVSINNTTGGSNASNTLANFTFRQ